ncbi:MAG: VWA domain-containing protein [Leptospiraceae bacterium]|nr:VWA domain-containing protein [Leptospiraceae bacterium]MCP5512638.1 VWA domain-containing protein [Leptospiraceae bacterium]
MSLKFNGKLFLILLGLVISFGIANSWDDINLPDKDGDGIYDKLEIAAGLNPDLDECQPSNCKDVSIYGITGDEYLIIILDQSLSMNDAMTESSTKMQSAKSVVKSFIQRNPPFLKLGMYAYGQNDCSALDEVRSPFTNFSKEELLKDVDTLEPRGSTPIAATLEKLREELRGKKGKFNILLVTDGVESCDGDPVAAAKSLTSINTLDTGVKLFIAGLKIPPGQGKQLEQVAIASQGKYYPIDSEAEFKNIFDPPLKEIIKNLEGLVCLQIELDKLIKCEKDRMNKIRLVSNKKLINPFNKDFTPEEKEFLRIEIPKLETKAKGRIDDYNRIRHEGSNKHKKKIVDLSKLLKPGS